AGEAFDLRALALPGAGRAVPAVARVVDPLRPDAHLARDLAGDVLGEKAEGKGRADVHDAHLGLHPPLRAELPAQARALARVEPLAQVEPHRLADRRAAHAEGDAKQREAPPRILQLDDHLR